MKTILSVALLLMASVFHSQTKDIAGIYGEGLLNRLNPAASYIELKPDSTFIYNYYGKIYEGHWKLSGNKVLLNPDLRKEFAKVKMKESRNNSDSITIKISYIPKKDDSGNTVSNGFKMATVYFDKKANYINILKSPYVKSSGRAPYIDRQNILNKENSVSVSKKIFHSSVSGPTISATTLFSIRLIMIPMSSSLKSKISPHMKTTSGTNFLFSMENHCIIPIRKGKSM
uniref:Uncharacterized protein n=1 Tax=Chryseobacterium endophyticum TaxID=1854762 RepID=A0AAU6WQ25_9FLAO